MNSLLRREREAGDVAVGYLKERGRLKGNCLSVCFGVLYTVGIQHCVNGNQCIEVLSSSLSS